MHLQLLYIKPLFQNFKNSPNIQKYSDRSKKHKPSEWYHTWCLYKIENYPIETVGGDAYYSYYISYHYFKISKIRQKFKNIPIVIKSTSQVSDIILDACVKFENYPIETVGEDAYYSYYILYYYFKVSKIRQKLKNSPIVKKITRQVSDIILDACMKFENYPINTVGEDAFYSYYISYNYFKISKIRQKFKNIPIVKKSTSQVSDIILDACMKFENYPIETIGGDPYYIYYILYQKFKNSSKIQK